MPLSEEEMRLLEQMERALVAEDPKFASALRGTSLGRRQRRRAVMAAAAFVVGVVLLMTGAVVQQTAVGIAGFVVMLGSAYVALTSWRGATAAEDEPQDPGQSFGLTVIEGGKGSRPRKGRRGGAPHHSSFVERMEERWRRRRDEHGGL